jgi:hypothetical protein
MAAVSVAAVSMVVSEAAVSMAAAVAVDRSDFLIVIGHFSR